MFSGLRQHTFAQQNFLRISAISAWRKNAAERFYVFTQIFAEIRRNLFFSFCLFLFIDVFWPAATYFCAAKLSAYICVTKKTHLKDLCFHADIRRNTQKFVFFLFLFVFIYWCFMAYGKRLRIICAPLLSAGARGNGGKLPIIAEKSWFFEKKWLFCNIEL